MKKIYPFVLLFLLQGTNIASGQNPWTQGTNFPGIGRFAAICFELKNKAYMGTGLTLNSSTLHKDFWEYDPSTGVWTQKANFGGTARFSAAEFTINDTGYVGLGSTGYPGYVWVTDFWMYDPASNSWTQRNNFPAPGRYDIARFSINGKGYVGTGWSGTLYNDFWEYNPSLDQWTQKANFPSASRQATAYFSYSGKGYIGFGANGGTFYNDLYEYDPISDSWTQKANCPGQVRNNTAQFIVGNYIYVGLGFSYSFGYMNDVWRYDPSADSWMRADSFPGLPRYHACTFVVDCKAYLTTGYTSNGIDENDFWEYNLCSSNPSASFQSSDSTICTNSCINYTDRSSNATSWLWSFPGATPSSSTDQNPQSICYFVAGNYNVSLIVSNGSGTDTLKFTNYITVYPTPATPVITQSGDSLFCSTDPTYSSYQWYYFNTPIPGATNTFLVVSFNGNYNVRVSNEDGCSIAVGINVVIGLHEFSTDNLVSLYPNPASELLSIHSSSLNTNEVVSVSVINLVGEVLQEEKRRWKGEAVIDIKSLPKGIYFLQIKSESGRVVNKFVKE